MLEYGGCASMKRKKSERACKAAEVGTSRQNTENVRDPNDDASDSTATITKPNRSRQTERLTGNNVDRYTHASRRVFQQRFPWLTELLR